MVGLDFSFSELIKYKNNSIFTFDPIFDLLFNSSNFIYAFTMFVISFLATILLGILIRYKISKKPNVGESRKVEVITLTAHDNEFMLKSSGLITIITVLYTASSGFAIICTALLSFYSPIWSYNSLIRVVGCIFVKADVRLDSRSKESNQVLVIATKSTIKTFEYDPSNPMKMNIFLFNKISLIGKS
ncbi:hypothetical protein V4T71_002837 [Vibrio vulnificus]|nr:hypothetical protein [Vibrio vulnificus]